MRFTCTYHRHADAIIKNDIYLNQRFNEFCNALNEITDEELIDDFLFKQNEHNKRNTAFKSMTPSINELLKKKMDAIDGWKSEVDIFNDSKRSVDNTAWRLDFACENGFAVEVAFNHGEAIAWNLLKPVLASELNHVRKAVQTQVGIYVCATDQMKKAGNIDSASGSYEKVLRYLQPMMNQLTVPIVVIGLEPFESFRIDKNSRKVVYL